MPKDRRLTSSSVDRRAAACPYSRSSKTSDLGNPETLSPRAKECEEAQCPICMEHPHNAVLLHCSSSEKGCRPFICDTSYRHSNCLDQFRKLASSILPLSQSQLICPLCRGTITGWEVVGPARMVMNSKTRNCSLENCGFSGNYVELRKHARRDHPRERPSEAVPSRKHEWSLLERQMEMEDVLAHQSDGGFGLDGLWSDGSFFDFPSGMSDVDDALMDEMFSGLSISFMSLYSPRLEDEVMDSGSSRSMGVDFVLGGELEGLRRSRGGENEENNGRRRSSYRGENEARNERSRSSRHWGLRSSYLGENEGRNEGSRSIRRRDDGFGSRWSDERSRYWEESGRVSWPRLSHHRSYREEYSSRERGRSRSRYGQTEVGRRGFSGRRGG